MKKLVLKGASILAVVLLVLGAQSNVFGYQTVQSSVKKRLNEKDILFQTICDLADNKEIQKAILESQGKFQNPFPSTQQISFPTITKRQLYLMYFLGLVLFQIMGKARMESLVKAHPINVQANDRINSIIGNNTRLKEETAQLTILNCPSCTRSLDWGWNYPIICTILVIIDVISVFLMVIMHPGYIPLTIWMISHGLIEVIDCKWSWPNPGKVDGSIW
jgi:hypothetical protein